MSKSILITVPHALGKDEARRRVAAEIDLLKNAYIDKFAHSEVVWRGDAAEIRVVALTQEIKAHIDVAADSVRVEILLPWLLATLASKIESRLTTTARDTLALTHSPNKK
ncbi:MAG: polyhydroxyalkanoic acid system family protein [Methylovirgula sp.]